MSKIFLFLKDIYKFLYNVCKNDVYYTLFFSSLVYILLYILISFFYGFDIGDYKKYCAAFMICKWLIFLSSAITSYKIFSEYNKLNSIFVFGFIAILYNPFYQIPFEDNQWFIAMVLTLLLYLHFSVKFYFTYKHNYHCDVCMLKPNFLKLYKIPIYKGGFKKGEIHYDADMYICEKCYKKCKVCNNCGHPIMPDQIKNSLGEWESTFFCTCKNKK